MLKHLTRNDIHAIIKECETLNAGSKTGVIRGDEISIDELFHYFEERQRLTTLLANLSNDALMELEALMWTGRHEGRSFAQNLEYAYKNKSEGTIGYIASKSIALPKYLRAGLVAISI